VLGGIATTWGKDLEEGGGTGWRKITKAILSILRPSHFIQSVAQQKKTPRREGRWRCKK